MLTQVAQSKKTQVPQSATQVLPSMPQVQTQASTTLILPSAFDGVAGLVVLDNTALAPRVAPFKPMFLITLSGLIWCCRLRAKPTETKSNMKKPFRIIVTLAY